MTSKLLALPAGLALVVSLVTVCGEARAEEGPSIDESSAAKAEAQFRRAEEFYKTKFEPYKVVWKGNIIQKNANKAAKAVADTLNELKQIAFDASALYKEAARLDTRWSLTASVRLGDVAFFFGQKLLAAPVPTDIVTLDKKYPAQGILNAYTTQLVELVRPQKIMARGYWQKAVDAGKAKGISTDWTKLAQQRLDTYKVNP